MTIHAILLDIYSTLLMLIGTLSRKEALPAILRTARSAKNVDAIHDRITTSTEDEGVNNSV